MEFKNILAQVELSKKSIMEMKNLNCTFENLLQEAVKGAPEKDKKKMEELRSKSVQAIRLAEEGKADEAQKIILDLQNGN